MSSFFTIVFFGMFFGIFPIILFYAGIFVTYLSHYNIKDYFNPFFIYNINLYLYILFAFFSGIAFFLKTNILRYLYLLVSVLMLFTFITDIGVNVGHKILYKPNTRIINNDKIFIINVVYKNKNRIYYNTSDDPKINILDVK